MIDYLLNLFRKSDPWRVYEFDLRTISASPLEIMGLFETRNGRSYPINYVRQGDTVLFAGENLRNAEIITRSGGEMRTTRIDLKQCDRTEASG